MTENQIEPEKRNPEPIGERLLKLIQHYYLNMNSLSVRLRLPSNSVITRIVKDPNRGMSLELIQKVLFEFPEINPDWFVTGRGEMFLNNEIVKTEPRIDLGIQCTQLIENLKEIIKSKDEVISAKDALISNLERGEMMRKRDASG